MGVWGTGLYSGDFPLDLRSAISAVCRLPLDPDELVNALCDTEPGAAFNESDEDHSTFWLLLADQLAKRGIASAHARDRALAIIDTGADLETHRRRGMPAPVLARRQKLLLELRHRLAAMPSQTRPRNVLKKPQPYLMEIGDVIAYPTSAGKPINPYITPGKERSTGPLAWSHDGWSAFLIVDRGRAFDFLTWYTPIVAVHAVPEKPVLSALEQPDVVWTLKNPGTCSPVHFKRMRLEPLANLAVDSSRLRELFPEMRPGHSQAISDISISNRLTAGTSARPYPLAPFGVPAKLARGLHRPLLGIRQILQHRD